MSDTPVAGYYLARLVRGGPMVPIDIYRDPRTPSGFAALAAGEIIDVWRVWPHCGRNPVDEDEYRYRLAHLDNAEAAGEIDRRKPINHLKTRTMF